MKAKKRYLSCITIRGKDFLKLINSLARDELASDFSLYFSSCKKWQKYSNFVSIVLPWEAISVQIITVSREITPNSSVTLPKATEDYNSFITHWNWRYSGFFSLNVPTLVLLQYGIRIVCSWVKNSQTLFEGVTLPTLFFYHRGVGIRKNTGKGCVSGKSKIYSFKPFNKEQD